jgi:hypothetical protein
MRRWLQVIVVLGLAACGVAERFPPPPGGVAAIGVAPVENETGNELAVAGDSYLARWIGREKRTVPDVLARELATTLRDRGFSLGSGSSPRLRVVLRRFDPDVPQLAYVTVALTATLADPDGTLRWTGERSAWLVSTTGAPSLEAAYDAAARAVARGLVEGWTPTR